jgi:hypothetical protein
VMAAHVICQRGAGSTRGVFLYAKSLEPTRSITT